MQITSELLFAMANYRCCSSQSEHVLDNAIFVLPRINCTYVMKQVYTLRCTRRTWQVAGTCK